MIRAKHLNNLKIELLIRIPGHTVDILFIYLDQNLPVFSKTEKAIKSVLKKIPSLLSSVS